MRRHLLLFLPVFIGPALLFGASPKEIHRSTVTGDVIRYNEEKGEAIVEGEAVVVSSTATLKADQLRIKVRERKGTAEGNVELIQENTRPISPTNDPADVSTAPTTLTGTRAEYDWESSTGVIYQGKGVSPPWSFSAERMIQNSRRVYLLMDGSITSCDHDPPHYRIRSKKGRYITKTRANMRRAKFVVDEFPTLWTPFYTKSLIPKKYTLRIEPGQSSRDGFTNRTIFSYPFSPNTRTKMTWDYLQETGNRVALEHDYSREGLSGQFNTSYLRDINSDPQPKRRRYDILWSHYQKVTKRLTMNSRIDFISDQTFANESDDRANGIRVQNAERGVFSEMGLTYQWSKATLQVDADRRDRFDSSVSSETFISKLTLPRVTFNTIPLKPTFLPFYTRFSGSWINESRNRADPMTALRYQRSGSAGIEVERDIRIRKKLTISPNAGFTQSWQDRKDRSVGAASEKDVYVGRYNVGGSVRRRLFRGTDVRTGYSYNVRFRENTTVMDTLANDRGVEQNLVTTSLVSRIGRNNRLSLSSGYDLRSAPRNDLTKYTRRSQRILSPSADLQVQVSKNVNVFFRETYQVFPDRTPLNTSGQIQVGNQTSLIAFSQGFSYTKSASGVDSVINFTNRLKFFLTRKWYVNAFLSYQAVGPNKLNYRKLFATEKTITVVRDLHCWVFRAEFSERTGRREVSVNIDLKTNMSLGKSVFRDRETMPFYPFQAEKRADSEVFGIPPPPEGNTPE